MSSPTMRAVVYDAVGATPYVTDVPRPTPPPGGVVVAVEMTGLCRSDWHAWAGHDEIATFPHVPGHELAGTVHAVGVGVLGWHVGDRVTSPFVEGCGACAWCAAGDAQVCPDQEQPGFTHAGSFAEEVVVHAADTNLVALPDAIDARAAASLGCRYATAFRGLTSRARLRAGEWLAVVGAGGVGLSAVQIGKALGASVVVVDRDPAALDLAVRLGADHVVATGSGTPTDVAAAVTGATGGGAHVAVDAVGAEAAAATSLLSLRRRGRHVQIGLLPAATGHPRLPMDRVIGWELDVLGSHGMAAVDYPGLLALVSDGSVRPQDLVTRVVGLEEAARLLPRTDRGSTAGITLVDPRA